MSTGDDLVEEEAITAAESYNYEKVYDVGSYLDYGYPMWVPRWDAYDRALLRRAIEAADVHQEAHNKIRLFQPLSHSEYDVLVKFYKSRWDIDTAAIMDVTKMRCMWRRKFNDTDTVVPVDFDDQFTDDDETEGDRSF